MQDSLMLVQYKYTITEFVDLLVQRSGYNITSLAKVLGANKKTLYNWKAGKPYEISTIENMRPALQDLGIQIGRITNTYIEVLEERSQSGGISVSSGRDQTISESQIGFNNNRGNDDMEKEILKEKNKMLLQKNIDLETQIEKLNIRIQELEKQLGLN